MTMWTVLLALGASALLYGFVIRPVIRNISAVAAAYRHAETIEQSVWRRIALGMIGLRTIVAARLLALCGLLVGLHDTLLPYAAGVDWTPFMAQVPAWAVPLTIMATGVLFEWLRRITAPVPAGSGASRNPDGA